MGKFDKAAQFGARFFEGLGATEAGRVISPLTLHNKEQLTKLGSLISTNVADAGVNYFKGSSLNAAGAWGDPNAKLAFARKAMAASAFGLLAANGLGINPGGLTDKANNLAALGAHYTIGRGLMNAGGAGKMLGVGYLAATAINTFRPGDNLGPM